MVELALGRAFLPTRHTAVRVGDTTRTLGRHNEVDDVTAGKFFDQFADELGGKGWWR